MGSVSAGAACLSAMATQATQTVDVLKKATVSSPADDRQIEAGAVSYLCLEMGCAFSKAECRLKGSVLPMFVPREGSSLPMFMPPEGIL